MDNGIGNAPGNDAISGFGLSEENSKQNHHFSLLNSENQPEQAGDFFLHSGFSNISDQALREGLATGMVSPDMALSMIDPNSSTGLTGLSPSSLDALGRVNPLGLEGSEQTSYAHPLGHELDSQGFFNDLKSWMCDKGFVPGCTPSETYYLGNAEPTPLRCAPPTCEKLENSSVQDVFLSIKDGNPIPKLSAAEGVEIEFKDFAIHEIELKEPSNGQPFNLAVQIGDNLVPMAGVYWKFNSGVELFVGGGTNDGCNIHHRAELKIPMTDTEAEQPSGLPVGWVKKWLGCEAVTSMDAIAYKCDGAINLCRDGTAHHTPAGGINVQDGALILTGAAAMAAMATLAPEVAILMTSGALINAGM